MQELTSQITAVTVYPDRARVTRAVALELAPGKQQLAFPELPLTLDAASVRAAAHGTARGRLLGVDVQRKYFAVTPAARVRALEEEIEALQDALAAHDGEVGRLEEERVTWQGLLGATETYARGIAFGKISAEEQLALLQQLYTRLEEIDGRLHALEIERRERQRELEKLQAELKQLQGARGRERYTAVVELDVATAGEMTVELTYVVAKAGWSPLYDLRLLEEADEPQLEVSYLAQVKQQTGEDWDAAALTLSTARPALSETLPELDPWYIMPRPQPQPMALGAPPAARKMSARMQAIDVPDAAAPEMVGAFMEDRAPAPAPMEVVTAEVKSSGTAVTYAVPGTVTVPGDGAPHKVTVAIFALEPELNYVTTPKITEAVYRRAAVDNESPYTLLPGQASLFAGDEFIGMTQLELTAPEGEIELYLGVDDRIKVERKLVQRDVDKRLIGDRRRIRYAYEILLENRLGQPVELLVYDQIPVSRNEQLKVKLENVAPALKEEGPLGELRWELALDPRGKATLHFEFVVEHPRDMVVIGLP